MRSDNGLSALFIEIIIEIIHTEMYNFRKDVKKLCLTINFEFEMKQYSKDNMCE